MRTTFLSLEVGSPGIDATSLDKVFARLTHGAIVVCASHGLNMSGFERIKTELDEVAATRGLRFCELPTGQGLLIVRHR